MQDCILTNQVTHTDWDGLCHIQYVSFSEDYIGQIRGQFSRMNFGDTLTVTFSNSLYKVTFEAALAFPIPRTELMYCSAMCSKNMLVRGGAPTCLECLYANR